MSNIKENSSKITGFQRKKNILGTALEKKKSTGLRSKTRSLSGFLAEFFNARGKME